MSLRQQRQPGRYTSSKKNLHVLEVGLYDEDPKYIQFLNASGYVIGPFKNKANAEKATRALMSKIPLIEGYISTVKALKIAEKLLEKE
jgi:hypothetical protein